MPETTMGAYWPKISRLTQYVVRKRIVTEAERDARAAANEEHPRSLKMHDQCLHWSVLGSPV